MKPFKLVVNKFWSYIKTFITKASVTKTNKLLNRVSYNFWIFYNFYDDLTMIHLL